MSGGFGQMNILVTGGAGFIGSHFVELVAKKGHHCVVVDALTYAGRRENLNHVPESQYTFFNLNICDAPAVGELLRRFDVDAIFNFAAETHVDRSIDAPADFVMTNVVGTSMLLTAGLQHWERQGKKSGFRFVQVSTDEVFGSIEGEGAFTESSPYAPNSPYSASKAGGDFLVRAWNKTYGLPTVITHCTNNYGPRQYPEKLIPAMILRALRGQPLGVYGDGQHVRDWLHVADHCEGIWLAFERGQIGAHYCFGGGHEVANLNLVHQLCDVLDRERPRKQGSYRELIQFVTDRLGHDRRYAVDFNRATRELGFRPQVEFARGFPETIRWFLNSDFLTTAAADVK
jgi:dTDP-glucose 4,6-dehydratase